MTDQDFDYLKKRHTSDLIFEADKYHEQERIRHNEYLFEAQFEKEHRINFIRWVRAKVAAGLNPRDCLHEIRVEEEYREPNY